MTLFDLFIFGLLAMFTGIGILRGAFRELLSIGGWLFAILCGWVFADAVGTWFEQLQDEDLRRSIAFIVIVMVTLALLSVAMLVLRILMPRPSPDLTSRVLGGAIGLFRGAVVVVVLVLLAGLTPLPGKDSWRNAQLVGVFVSAAEQVLDWLPAPVARQFRYG
jgi:membrane protein required for colicin V production